MKKRSILVYGRLQLRVCHFLCGIYFFTVCDTPVAFLDEQLIRVAIEMQEAPSGIQTREPLSRPGRQYTNGGAQTRLELRQAPYSLT